MNIDYAIVSADNESSYIEFWPYVSRLWNDLVGIKPVLVFICDRNDYVENKNYDLHFIKKNKYLPISTQSQISRMFATQYYKEKTCITSDIDMLPLSPHYFSDSIKEICSDNIAIMTSDAPSSLSRNRFPICYNAAKGKVFIEILKLSHSFEEYCKNLSKFNWGWDTDELFFGRMINKWNNKKKISFLKRGFNNTIATRRIDRKNWNYSLSEIKGGHFIDCHCPRNFPRNKKEIDLLIDAALSKTDD